MALGGWALVAIELAATSEGGTGSFNLREGRFLS